VGVFVLHKLKVGGGMRNGIVMLIEVEVVLEGGGI